MKDIIEHHIRENCTDDESIAEDFQVLNLGFSQACWQLAVHRLVLGRDFKISISIESTQLKMVLVAARPPHESVEFSREMTTDELEVMPSKIKEILNRQGYFHICSTDNIMLRSSGRPRQIWDERLYLVVGYRHSGLASMRPSNNNRVGNSSLHGSAVSNGSSVTQSLPSVCWFNSRFNAVRNYSIEEQAKLEFTKFTRAKKLLSSAGRSKPQGDLILYFAESILFSKLFFMLSTLIIFAFSFILLSILLIIC